MPERDTFLKLLEKLRPGERVEFSKWTNGDRDGLVCLQMTLIVHGHTYDPNAFNEKLLPAARQATHVFSAKALDLTTNGADYMVFTQLVEMQRRNDAAVAQELEKARQDGYQFTEPLTIGQRA